MKVFISGKMASGKTTLANFFVDRLGFLKFALADPIRQIESALTIGMSYDWVYEHHVRLPLSKKEQHILFSIFDETLAIPREHPKPRKRLQFLGTDGMRKRLRDTIWMDITAEAIAKSKWLDVVIDDVRFVNEYIFFTQMGFNGIKLLIGPDEQHRRLTELYGAYDPVVLDHVSEKEFDHILMLDTNTVINANLPKEKVFEQAKEALSL